MFKAGVIGVSEHAGWAVLVSSLLALASCSFAAVQRQGPSKPATGLPLLQPKVLLITFDPVIEAEGGKRLTEVCRWNEPEKLVQGYGDDVAEVSGGQARFQVVQRLRVDAFPLKKDGFRYTD